MSSRWSKRKPVKTRHGGTIYLRSRRDGAIAFVVEAEDETGESVGAIECYENSETGFVHVDQIDTESERGEGIGTRLYEEAARLACEKFKKPLASGFHRTAAANGFWKKQHAKGRAEELETPPSVADDEDARRTFFVLNSCPPPESLDGIRAKTCRRKRRR